MPRLGHPPLEEENGRAPRDPARAERAGHRLGSVDQGLPGPLFLAVGGMHGNEPSGVLAIERALVRIAAENLPFHGRLVGLAGNLEALARGTRYIDRDLNRMWADEELDAVRRGVADEHDGPETRARRALLTVLEQELAQRPTESGVVFLDLHSTSASGGPFSIIGDTLRNRHVARALPCPVLLGLEELVDGALLGYFGERGHVAVGFEGGEHGAPATVDHSEAALWLALIAAGCLREADVAGIAGEMRARLEHASAGIPRVVEVRLRHHVEPGTWFEMRPGYTNFDPVERGEWLANDRRGEIHAEFKGRVLLPLYQGQGQDGFFLGRGVSRFWLGLSRVLRGLRLESLLPLLPGVARVDGRSDRLRVDPRVARWFPVEIFHLFGYRRVRAEGTTLAFSRRVERPLHESR